mmetsp:Transcript_1505/g.5156  ORF Transcript_1505/g.5156 Transcript_1505/m.5156 type:complete len:123 (-) Transcript_1505:1188-1556(-)
MGAREKVFEMARVFKRGQRGLFAGKRIQFGNKISENGGNKSRRTWLPNVQSKRLYSETFEQMIPLKVTTAALRAIDRSGGLDKYLLRTRDDRLASLKGIQLKDALMRRLEKLARDGELDHKP